MKSYLFVNGKVYNSKNGLFEAKSLLTSQGKITCIADKSTCLSAAPSTPEIIDLPGRLLLPSFTDCHTHFVEHAKSRFMVYLDGYTNLEQIENYLQRYREQSRVPTPWILGGGWDRNLLAEPQELNRQLLDRIFPDKPVALMSKDYHSKLCNSLALKLAGIDSSTPDPQAGKIERDAQGEPTGVLYETAIDLVDKYITMPEDSVIISSIKDAVTQMYQWGLTGFHFMESRQSCSLLHQAQEQGARFRCCWHFPVDELDKVASEGLKSYTGDKNFLLGGMKIFGDGSLGSRTAAMCQPYDSDPHNKGILRYSDTALWELVEHAAQSGFGSTIHAIGDRCVHQVLSTIKRVQAMYPDLKLHHRMEHVQSIRPQDINLMRETGVFASVQPCHLANDVPMINKHWNSIAGQAYAFTSMLQAGIPLGFGSDTPIEPINPFLSIYTAVYRRPAYDPALPAFTPQEALSLPQALNGFTFGAAQSSCSESWQGTLEPGKVADLIVLEDFLQADESYWLTAQSVLTMIDGIIVHNCI